MPDNAVFDVTDANFQDEVIASDVPVLVDFWATWCGPCKAIAPHVAALADELGGKVKVVKLDAQDNMQTAQAHGVSNLPTFILFKNGQEVARKIGTTGGLNALRALANS